MLNFVAVVTHCGKKQPKPASVTETESLHQHFNHNPTANMDPSDALDVKQIFFTNLMLLGFDPTTMERKWRILFNKDMFDLPNKKAFEVVMYFLFERLSPTKCRNEFRDCWPVQDKKSEHEFRKVCNNWLMQISKEETDAHLPRIIASTFFAPGGAKFYQLLFCFSKFVLIKVMAQEHGLRQREFLRPPVLTPSTVEMSVAMERTLECATICSRRAFLKQVHQTGLAQEQWRQCAGELVKEYRSLKKKNHDKERTIRRQAQQAQEAHNLSVSGSPMGKSRKGADLHKFDFDIESIQRAQMLQKLRNNSKTEAAYKETAQEEMGYKKKGQKPWISKESWELVEETKQLKNNIEQTKCERCGKAVEGFVTGREKDREVVSAVLSDEDERCTVDARHMNVRVPDMLLRTCEREIQRRSVDNIYDGGKLNLLSLVQLSNLCLHLFIEKLHQVGLPDLDDAVPEVTAQLHRHQVHLANTRELEKKVEMELIPVIKASIKELKERLDTEPAIDCTNAPVNFNPTETGDTFGASFLEQLSKPLDSVSTPDAAVQLMTSVRKQVLSDSPASSSTLTGHHLAQGRPVYAPNARITDQQPMNTGRSRLPMRKSQSTDSKKGQPIVGVSQKRSATGGETRRQPCGDDAPTPRLVQSSTTFTETQWNLVDGAKQRLHDHKTPPKSSQEVRSSSDSNDSFLEWLSSSGRLTLTGSAQITEGATDLNPLAPRISEGFITTSTPHSNNVFNLTPSHETTPPRSAKTRGATPTHVATPTHKTTPTHSATPTHRATPTQGVTRQAWSDVGRGHVLDVNQNSVSQDAHSDPVVTTLFTGEHPGEDLRSAGSHDNVPKPSSDQQIDALVDRVMSDNGLRSFFTGDRMDHADQLISGGGVHSQSLSRESSMASSKGHDSVLEHNGREHFSPSTGQEIRDELVVRNGGAEKGGKVLLLGGAH
ncbi:hypothetical protein LSAT2_024989 [Lamellibrachia satsuma]|nr:hypothetical protein LSAT2_024989 [Lamellibrachia satsuma]